MKRFFKKILKPIAIFALIAVLGFFNVVSFLPQVLQNNKLAENLKIKEALAVTPKSMMVYDTNTNVPKYRIWDGTAWGAEANATALAASGIVQYVVLEFSRTRDEAILGTMDALGDIRTQVWNGTSWSATTLHANVGTTNDGQRGFDIAYETSGDRAIIVYNNANSADPSYKIWSAGAWSAATAITNPATTGAPLWIELAANPLSASNEIAMMFIDANIDVYGMAWTGTAWSEMGAGTAAWDATGAIATKKSIDIAYEKTTGRAMFIWGDATATDQYYRIWNQTSLTAATLLDIAASGGICEWVRLVTNPAADSNQLMYGCQDAGADLNTRKWSGSAWDTATEHPEHDATVENITSMSFDLVFETYSANANKAWIAYGDAATVSRKQWSGTAWGTATTAGDDTSYITLHANPTSGAVFQGVYQASTSASDDILEHNLTGGSATWTAAAIIWGGAVVAEPVMFRIAIASDRLPPPNTLTIGVTAGSKVSTINSGDSSVYANTTSCAASSTCAAFTLNVSNTSVTVSSIKITETGTADATADLSQLALFYDTDGNYSNGVTGQYGATVASFTSEAATVSGSLALTAATNYYFYVRFNASSTTTYPKGGQTVNFQIAANADVTLSSGTATNSGAPVSMAGTTTFLPNVISTTYGSGLSDGARSSESITISGYGFGVAPNGSQANCAGAVDTGCVRFIVGGNDTVADVDISTWSNTSIALIASSTLASYGGASGLQVVAGSQSDATNLNFYIYPRVSSLTVSTAVADAAREYDSADSDGLITLNGDHFGTASSTGYVRILGCDSATCSSPTGSVEIQTGTTCDSGDPSPGDGWSATCIRVRVPTVIADNSYTGNIVIQQGTGGNSKTHTFENTFRILPRIIGFVPSGGAAVGDAVTVNGNHFCQNAGTCPTVFDNNNRITFYSNVTSTVFNGWSNVAATTTVPTGASTGNVVLKSNSYDSNTKSFTVLVPTPSDPTNLKQSRNSGFTNLIPTGGYASSTPVYFAFDTSSGVGGGTMYSQIEIRPVLGADKDFTSTCAGNSYCKEGAGVAYTNGTITLTVSTSTADNSYHWQVRARYDKSGTNYYSAWKSYPDAGNPETATDLIVDTIVPTISFGNPDTCDNADGTPGTNNATITWSLTNESADGQVEYSATSTFSTSTNYPSPPAASSTSHSITISNLNSNTTYYWRAKSRDTAGNLATRPIPSDYCSFITQSVNQPAKTTKFYAMGLISQVTGGNTASTTFSVVMPENATSTKSAFVEIRGIYDTNGTSPNDIAVYVNSQASKTYVIPDTAVKTHFKIIYKVDPVNIDPSVNTIYITPESNTTIFISSVDIYVTYAYTP